MTLDPEIRELSPQPAVTEVAVTDEAGVPGVVDAGFPRLFGRLAELGVEPAGPPFIRYLRTGRGAGAASSGSRWARTPASRGAARRPGRRAAARRPVLRAPRRVRGAWPRWVAEQGEEPAGPFWESYVTNPREEPELVEVDHGDRAAARSAVNCGWVGRGSRAAGVTTRIWSQAEVDRSPRTVLR